MSSRKPRASLRSRPAAKQLEEGIVEVLSERRGCEPSLKEIFNSSQHVTSTDTALTQIKKLYKITPFQNFEEPFRNCVKKLLQSKQSIYFKTSCDFLCKFLQHVSKLSDEIKVKQRDNVTIENTAPIQEGKRGAKSNKAVNTLAPRRGRSARRGVKRKADAPDDELVASFISTATDSTMQTDSTDEDSLIMEAASMKRASLASQVSIPGLVTDHDRLVSACIDVADHYMQVADESCRLNAVFFIFKFLSHVESVDEEICNALRSTLPKRIRDRKPMIRAQAVLASRTFQDNKLTQEGFLHHFYRDPELVVRKALLQIMDTKIFGYDFLVDSTQDTNESMRRAAFNRLGKVSPFDLDIKQIHRVIHNGFNERERQASYSFRAHTLEPWLALLYDGLDLYKLVERFDVINHPEDVSRLLEVICERDLNKLEGSGATTRLHQVVESFRERWLVCENSCLPNLDKIDEKLVIVWLTLVKFCKDNQSIIKTVKVRSIQVAPSDANESIEEILDSQEKNDEVAELYERLTPDLVNLVEFLNRFIHHSDRVLKNRSDEVEKLEFIYHKIMFFISTYEVGDELERKTIQDVFGLILRENLLTGKFMNFIIPVIRNSFQLVYAKSSNLMINYISELIQNVRSHLEDLVTSTQPQFNALSQCSAIAVPCKTPRSAKKVRIDTQSVKKASYAPEEQNIEFKIATIRVELEELRDKLDECIKHKDFDQAKTINNKIDERKTELNLLHGRRCSMASDVSHMTMVVETEPFDDCKLSSTMIGDSSMDENLASQIKEDVKIFKHHTNELLKCLQMYIGCLKSVKISQVPETMLNHLKYMTYECLDDWFKEDTRVRSLMVTCHALTALVDKDFAKETTLVTLLMSAFCREKSLEMKIASFQGIVDILCHHDEVEVPIESVEKFLKLFLREYGKSNPNEIKKLELEFATVLIEGSTKLFYHRKISSPEVLSHLILWWYHPRTHSRLRQFIGVFLPLFVNDSSRAQNDENDTWLKDLLEETFVMSIEYLHNYILGPGFNIMAASDMLSLINFLCNLVPVSFHRDIAERVDYRIDELNDANSDLIKFLKQSKSGLNTAPSTNNTMIANPGHTTLARPLQIPD